MSAILIVRAIGNDGQGIEFRTATFPFLMEGRFVEIYDCRGVVVFREVWVSSYRYRTGPNAVLIVELQTEPADPDWITAWSYSERSNTEDMRVWPYSLDKS